MNKEFIPYEQALELKELGFDEECAAHFQNVGDLKPKWKQYDDAATFVMELRLLQAPLYQQAFRWFRENYGLYGFTYPSIIHNKTGKLLFTNNIDEPEGWDYDTHPEAELACLNKLIEIAKTK